MPAILPPPTRIYLLRHAEAAWALPGQKDFDRPLSEKGYADAEVVADRASDMGYKPDLVLSSTATRCRQTADAVHRAVGEAADLRFVDELYEATPDIYIAIIAAQSVESVMLIGHNPTMEQTLEALIGHQALSQTMPTGFPPAGLAVLDSDNSATGWRLVDFLFD